MKIRTAIIATGASALFTASSALAVHADVGFYSIGSRLATRGWDDATETPLDYQRVFEGELSLISGSVFGDEPGYNSPPGTFSSAGTATISIRAALRVWTGSGFALTTDRMNFQVFGGAQSVFTPAVDPANPDTDPLTHFDLPIDTDELHLHPDTYLLDSSLAGPGSPGIYLTEFHAEVNVDGLTRSYPYWIVYNYGQSEEDHEAAVDYTIENIVPAPGTAALLLGAGAMTWRRRR